MLRASAPPGRSPGEIIALRVADLGRGLEIGELFVGFEPFGDHGHAERLAQGFDRAQDALPARALMDVGDEGTVDLDLSSAVMSASAESEE